MDRQLMVTPTAGSSRDLTSSLLLSWVVFPEACSSVHISHTGYLLCDDSPWVVGVKSHLRLWAHVTPGVVTGHRDYSYFGFLFGIAILPSHNGPPFRIYSAKWLPHLPASDNVRKGGWTCLNDISFFISPLPVVTPCPQCSWFLTLCRRPAWSAHWNSSAITGHTPLAFCYLKLSRSLWNIRNAAEGHTMPSPVTWNSGTTFRRESDGEI